MAKIELSRSPDVLCRPITTLVVSINSLPAAGIYMLNIRNASATPDDVSAAATPLLGTWVSWHAVPSVSGMSSPQTLSVRNQTKRDLRVSAYISGSEINVKSSIVYGDSETSFEFPSTMALKLLHVLITDTAWSSRSSYVIPLPVYQQS